MVLPGPELRSLIRRCEFVPALLRRQIEEEIVALLVEPNLEPSEELDTFRRKHQLDNSDDDLDDWLQKRGWSDRDLRLHSFALQPCVAFKSSATAWH